MDKGIFLKLGIAFLIGVTATATAQTNPPEKAQRYLDMLRQRPQFGVVFERFLDAWYEESTPEALGDHLVAETAKPEAKAGDHVLLALYETRRGNEAAAVTAFKKGLALDPANPLAWQELARLQVRMLDFAQALESLDKALQQKPDTALGVEIEKQRGRVLLRTGKPEDALAAWRKLLEAHANDEDLAEEVVDVQLDEGLYTEAVSLMKSLIGKTKDAYAKVTRRMRLADIYLRAGMKAEALEELAEVIRQSGHDTWIEGEALAQTDQIFRKEDNLSGLAGHLDKLSKTEQQRVAIKRHLARVSAETGLKDQAFTIYKDLLARTPGRRDLREGYLELLERFGNFTEAIPQTKLLLEQNPGDKELHLRLASQQQLAGDPKAAGDSLNAYLAARGTGEYDHLRVAMQLENWDRKEDAKAAYEKLIAAYPESTSAREAKAHFLHRTGEREQALTIWKELGAKGGQEQVLAVAQALLARQEPKTAHEVLNSRLTEFGKDPHYLAPLLTAAINIKEQKSATPLAVERVRLTTDPGMLEDAIRQAVLVLEGAQEIPTIAKSLQGQSTMTVAERSLLATLLEEMGDKEAAERTLREVGAEDALLAQTRLVGLIETRQDWPRAAQELEKLIAMPEGRTSQNLQRLVTLRERSGEPEAALKVAGEWKTLSPGSVQPWLTEAALLGGLNKPQEAIKILRAASRKFEDDDNVSAALAGAYAEAGQFGDAERIFLRLVENADSLEDKIRWVSALALAAQSRNTLKEVTEKFRERQRSNREDATPWLALAEISRVANNEPERRRCLLEASRLRPKDIDLLHQIAQVEEDNGDFKQALQTLEKAAALDTGWRTKQTIAMMHLRSGDEQLGFRLLGDLMGGKDIEPKDALRLAEAMMAREYWEKAVAFLSPLVEKYPDDYRLRYLKAIALSESGDTRGAIAELLRVAAARTEVPDVLKKPNLQVKQPWEISYYANIEKTSPPGAVAVYQVTRHLYEATVYRMRRQYSGMTGSGVKVPPTVQSARSFAVANLIHLKEQDNPEGKAAITAALTAAGIEQAPVLMSLQPNNNAPWSVVIAEEALQEHPADPLLYLMWMEFSGNGNGNDQALPVELCQKAFALFKEKYPIAAFKAATAAVRTDPEAGLPLLKESLALMEQVKDPAAFPTMNLAQMLGGGQSSTQTERRLDVPDDIRQKLRALLIRFVLLTPPPKQGGFDFSMVYISNAFRADGGWEDYVTLWNHSLKNLKAAAPAVQKSAMLWPYSNSAPKTLLRPLPFPASDSLPALFTMMMQHPDPFNPHIQNQAHSGPEDDYAGIIPLLDRVEDPSMRMALAYKAGQSKRLEDDLLARANREDASLNELLMAASYASTTENPERAATFLLRLQSHPMDATRRTEVDSALVYAVTQLKDTRTPELLQAGQQAARRLRSAKLDATQRDELADAFANLDMKEESDQWRRLAALAPLPASSSSQRYYYSNYSRQSSQAKLEKALAKGNPEETIKVAIAELKGIKTQYWNGNSSYAMREATNLVTKLSFPDARAKLLAAMDPGGAASPKRREEFASMLELVGESARAQQVYEEILQRSPDSHESRVRLLGLIARGDPQKASTLLEGVPLKALNQGLGAIITELCNDDDLPMEGRMAIFNAMSSVLEKHADDESVRKLRTELDWIQELPPFLGFRSYSNGRYAPYLFDRDPFGDKRYRYVDANSPELKVRREALNRLCKAMMLHPRLAGSAFSWYAGLFLHEKGNPEELLPLATGILEKCRTIYAGGAAPPAMMSRRYGSYDEITAVWRPQPAEFLVWHAWKQGRTSVIESEILPAAQQAVDRGQFALLKAQARVWTCTPEEFPSAAESFIRTAAANSSIPSHLQTGNLVWLMDRALERKVPYATLDKLLLGSLKTIPGYSEGNCIQLYIQTRRQLDPDADTSEFLKQMLSSVLGPQQLRWKPRMIAYANSQYGSGSSNDRDAYNAGSIISALGQRVDTKAQAAQASILTGLIHHRDWVRNNLASNLGEVAKDAKLAVDFLEKSDFLKEAAEIRVTMDPDIVGPIFNALRESSEARKGVVEALKSKPRTFGVELAEVMLQLNNSAALTEFLKRRKADLPAIPQDRIAGFSLLIKNNLPAARNVNGMEPALKEALQPILAAELAEQKSLFDKWMTAKRVDDLQLDEEKYEQALVQRFVQLSEGDRTKAVDFFNHACKLMEAKEATQNWDSGSGSNGWTLRSAMLFRAIKEAAGMRMLALSMHLYQEDTTGNLTMEGSSQIPKWGQTLHDAWKLAGGHTNMEQGLKTMLTTLQKELGDTPPTLLPLAFYDMFHKVPPGLRVAVVQSAEKLTSDPTLAALAKELAFAGRFFLASENAARSNPEMQKALADLGGVEPVWQHEVARLRDEKLNPRARLALAHHLCYRAPEMVPADIASTGADLALDTQQRFHCMHGYQYGWLLKAWCRQPVTEEWKTQAQAHWVAWTRRCQRSTRSRSQQYAPHEWPILNVLRMVAHADHEAWMSELPITFSRSLRNDPSSLVILAGEGRVKEAVRWLRTSWSSIVSPCDTNILWNAGLAKAAAQLQAENAGAAGDADADFRFLSEVMISNLPDPIKADQALIPNFVDRRKRMVELAKRMKTMTFTNSDLKSLCLEEFGQHYYCYELLAPLFDEAAPKVDVTALIKRSDMQEYFRRLKPVTASTCRKLWAGDPKPAIAAYDKATALPTTIDYYYRRTMARYSVEDVLSCALTKWSSVQQPDRTALLALVDHILAKTPDDLIAEHVADAVALKILIHHLDGHPEAIAEWRKTLTVDRTQKLKNSFTRRFRMWTYFDTMNVDPKFRMKPEQRAALIGAVLKDEWIGTRYPDSGTNVANLLSTITKDKGLKPEEIAVTWKPIAEAYPRKGRTAGEAADILSQRGLLDDALAAFNLAISQSSADYATSAAFICRKAELLERMHRNEEATADLLALDEKKMGAGGRTQRTAILKRLQKEEKPAAGSQ